MSSLRAARALLLPARPPVAEDPRANRPRPAPTAHPHAAATLTSVSHPPPTCPPWHPARKSCSRSVLLPRLPVSAPVLTSCPSLPTGHCVCRSRPSMTASPSSTDPPPPARPFFALLPDPGRLWVRHSPSSDPRRPLICSADACSRAPLLPSVGKTSLMNRCASSLSAGTPGRASNRDHRLTSLSLALPSRRQQPLLVRVQGNHWRRLSHARGSG